MNTIASPSSATSSAQSITVVCGLESVGKTQLLASLTGRLPTPENFRGSTLACETYRDGNLRWMDTPGLYRESETETARTALTAISDAESVTVIARADRALEELETLLPVVAGKTGFVVLTFADRLPDGTDLDQGAAILSASLGVPVFALDARHPMEAQIAALRAAAAAPEIEAARFPETSPSDLTAPFPARSVSERIAERIVSHPLVALALLFLPAGVAVVNANRFADWLYDPLSGLLSPLLEHIATWPNPLDALFGGD